MIEHDPIYDQPDRQPAPRGPKSLCQCGRKYTVRSRGGFYCGYCIREMRDILRIRMEHTRQQREGP